MFIELKQLINSKWFLLSLLFSVIQQTIVASSTIWIVLLGRAVAQGDKAFILIYFCIFITSLGIVYIPSSIMRFFITKAQFESYRKYIQLFHNNFYGFPTLKHNEVFRRERQPYLNNEGWLIITGAVFFLSDWFAIILNVLFNIVALSVVVDKSFIFSYLLAIPIILLILKKSNSVITAKSISSQKYRANMFQTVFHFWDTILIGNKYNINNWNDKFNLDYHGACKSTLSSIICEEIVTDTTMIFSLLPILGNLLLLVVTKLDNMAAIIGIIATLPRQIQIIQYISDLVSNFTRWKGIKAKLQGLVEAALLPKNQSNGHIIWNDLFLENENNVVSVSSIDDLKKQTNLYAPGRYTLRGPNGSGKTTILSKIKELEKENTFYLPSQSALIFLSTDEKNLSTGERITAIMNEIENVVTEDLLLLDEWDANLDQTNIKLISEKINRLAKRKCIIEVRHREK